MIVVTDTSPLCYLILIGCVDVLPKLFGRVCIPQAVRVELTSTDAPTAIQSWMAQLPRWLETHPVSPSGEAGLINLHAGEREAIILAETLKADIIVLDEKVARRIAANRGLRVTGTLGLLDEAAARSLIDLTTTVERLRLTNFRASPRLLQALLERHS
jgi:predicted nucleic acid-binding protein